VIRWLCESLVILGSGAVVIAVLWLLGYLVDGMIERWRKPSTKYRK
jgi:hypothetical protein